MMEKGYEYNVLSPMSILSHPRVNCANGSSPIAIHSCQTVFFISCRNERHTLVLVTVQKVPSFVRNTTVVRLRPVILSPCVAEAGGEDASSPEHTAIISGIRRVAKAIRVGDECCVRSCAESHGQ